MSIRIGVHAVLEALKAGQPLDRVVVAKGAAGPRLDDIIALARRHSIPVRFEPRAALDRLAAASTHQGVVAIGAARQAVALEDIAKGASMLVVLDGVEDPHNLGAIVRTAHAAGASGVVIPDRRAVGLTETAGKAAAGALEYLPVARVGNISQALEKLKQLGFWIYGLDERGDQEYDQVDYATPTALVFGGEGKGLHEQVRKHCDALVRIRMAGKISSLNVSVAAGVVLFEWRRRSKGAA